MIVHVPGDRDVSCSAAVKGANYIALYDENGAEIERHAGISDFTGYSVSDGAWIIPKGTVESRLDAYDTELDQIVTIMEGLANG